MEELGDEWLAEMIGWWKELFQIAPSGGAENLAEEGSGLHCRPSWVRQGAEPEGRSRGRAVSRARE